MPKDLDQDLSAGLYPQQRRSLVIVVNRWDGLSQEVKEQVETLDIVWALSTLPGALVSALRQRRRQPV